MSEKYATVPPLMPAKLFLCWSVLLCLCWLGLLWVGEIPYQRQAVQWPVQSEKTKTTDTLYGDLWLKESSNGLQAGVILVHGVMASRQQSELAARTLALQGYRVLNFDLRGYGESSPASDLPEIHQADVLSAIHYLRSSPGINPHQIVLIGHSMGAQAVIDAAPLDGHLSGVIAIGMDGKVSGVEWFTGLYDALHPPEAYANVTVSPASNHQSEWYDVLMLESLQKQLASVFGTKKLVSIWPEIIRYWCSIGLALNLMIFLGYGLSQIKQDYFKLAIISALIGLALLCGMFHWLEPSICANITTLALVSYGLTLWGRQFPKRIASSLFWLSCLIIAHELSALLRAIPWLMRHLTDLIYYPLYVWQAILVYPTEALHRLNPILFSHSQPILEVSWVLGVALLAEWLMPGWWLKGFIYLQRSQLTGKGANRTKTKGAWVILGLSCSVFVGMISLRLGQGYLTAEAFERVWQNLKLEILPTALILTAIIVLKKSNLYFKR